MVNITTRNLTCVDCQSGYAKCPMGARGERCIPENWFCDMEPDCEIINGTAFDEVNCSKYSNYCAYVCM